MKKHKNYKTKGKKYTCRLFFIDGMPLFGIAKVTI